MQVLKVDGLRLRAYAARPSLPYLSRMARACGRGAQGEDWWRPSRTPWRISWTSAKMDQNCLACFLYW